MPITLKTPGLKNKINNIKIPTNYNLDSLNAISLYTNIPATVFKSILLKKKKN